MLGHGVLRRLTVGMAGDVVVRDIETTLFIGGVHANSKGDLHGSKQ